MHWLIYICGSGLAFFIGVGCMIAAVAISFGRWAGWSKVSTLLAILGIILIAISGTPLSIGFYVVAISLTIAWLIATRLRPNTAESWKSRLRLLVALVWIGGALWELRYQITPPIAKVESRQLYLFGDSLAAGTGEDPSNNWPQLLARLHAIELANYSRAGAKVATAMQQANDAVLGEGIVLLEIGGNDLLGGTPGDIFQRNLEELLKKVCQPGRQVLMFELPVPPFHNDYGQIQRRLANQYHVTLIPKRILMGVLAGSDATLDSIHLSAAGHQQMADSVWQILRPAYQP